MTALWTILETHGLPQALYTDRAGWAFYTPKAGEPVCHRECKTPQWEEVNFPHPLP